MGMTVAGVAWVVLERPSRSIDDEPHDRHGLGILLGVTAAAAGAGGIVLSRQGIGDYDAASATYIRILGSLPGYLVLITVLARWPAVLKTLSQPRPMGVIFCGTIVGPFVGVILCMVAVRHSPAGVVATILSTMPILVLPFSILVFREKVSWRAAGGALLAVLGVALMCWES
jgi:drug/metabolite transporter (DMT)-like permease